MSIEVERETQRQSDRETERQRKKQRDFVLLHCEKAKPGIRLASTATIPNVWFLDSIFVK